MVNHQSKYAKSGASAAAPSRPAKVPAKKEPVCLWINFEAQFCDSCEQDTHIIDRDSLPEDPQYVKWIKMNAVPGTNLKKPSGCECHDCFYVRRS